MKSRKITTAIQISLLLSMRSTALTNVKQQYMTTWNAYKNEQN